MTRPEELSFTSPAGDTEGDRAGSSPIGPDLLVGIVDVTVPGTVIQLIASALRQVWRRDRRGRCFRVSGRFIT